MSNKVERVLHNASYFFSFEEICIYDFGLSTYISCTQYSFVFVVNSQLVVIRQPEEGHNEFINAIYCDVCMLYILFLVFLLHSDILQQVIHLNQTVIFVHSV